MANLGEENGSIMIKKVFVLVVMCSLIFVVAKAQDLQVVKSNYLKTNDSVFVYKPATYNAANEFALVYLLHGHSANFRSWSKLADLQMLANQYNMVIVCPDGLKKSWYINSLLKDSSQYESFFVKELVPFVHQKYKINAKQVFITGASMGGYGSLWLFMHHSEYFRSAGSTSGTVNLHHSGFKASTIAEHLGAYSSSNKYFDRYAIVNNVPLLAKANKEIIFDCGTEDYLYKSNKALRDSCDLYKVKSTYTAQPGKHTGGYWSTTILTHFQFFNQLLKEDERKFLSKG